MNRKTLILCSVMIILSSFSSFLLAGCSGTAAVPVSASTGLSTATQLAVGTLKLEGTSQAVTTTQAAQLLILWEGYQSLSKSNTSSQFELDALVKQIQAVMTSDQLQAIETMNLTDQSISVVMQSLGSSAISSASVSTPGSSSLSQTGAGGGPGGMPEGGGDSVMSAINGGMSTQSTLAVAQSTVSTAITQVNSMLLNSLIQMLKTRSQTAG